MARDQYLECEDKCVVEVARNVMWKVVRSSFYIIENEQQQEERMLKKDLDHYVHNSQHVIHNKHYELLSAYYGFTSIKIYY